MKHIITLIAVAFAFTLGGCCNESCPTGAKKAAGSCQHGKGDTCCAEKAPAKKK